ncbi:MAG: hypothetical protein IJR06_00590 [Paludibacteraceae bacterium]|nr:hypothetical protein [Paludibacteraceae bacterium]
MTTYNKPRIKNTQLECTTPICSSLNETKVKEPIKFDQELGLERRKHIQYFVSDTKRKQGTFTRFILEDEENIILGYEYVVYEGKKFIYYIYPMRNSKALIFFCIDSKGGLEELLSTINSDNIQICRNTWPRFMNFIDNNHNENFYKPFLLPFDISGEKFYGVAKMMENVSFSDYENKYVIDCMYELFNQVLDALDEYRNNEISFTDKIKYTIQVGSKAFVEYNRINTVINLLSRFF